MAHTFASQLLHCVFSTKNRLPLIDADWRQRLHAYMGGIARENNCKALVVGGVADHAHMLLSLPTTMTIAKAMQSIKGGSSLWVHEELPAVRGFGWQEGYGAFSIGISQVDATIAYINGQEEHHRTISFQDEFRGFLRRHGIEWDERYIWG